MYNNYGNYSLKIRLNNGIMQEKCMWLKGYHLEDSSINKALIVIQPFCSKQDQI